VIGSVTNELLLEKWDGILAIAKVSIVFALMSNIGFVLSGRKRVQLMMLKLLIIIHEVSIKMVRISSQRVPTHPGEMLLHEFLEPLGLTQKMLAEALHVPYQRVNELIRGKRGMTPSTALRLAKFFGNSPDFWLNLQLRWDLYHVQQAEFQELEKITTYISA
jgi:addiction module HigA family antidote